MLTDNWIEILKTEYKVNLKVKTLFQQIKKIKNITLTMILMSSDLFKRIVYYIFQT